MQINLIHPGQPVADFSIHGSVVTVAGVSIDCADRQQDVAVHIEVRSNNGAASEGGTGAYLAQIEIPARRYEINYEQPEEGAEGDEQEVRLPLPLDPNAVSVTLWPIV